VVVVVVLVAVTVVVTMVVGVVVVDGEVLLQKLLQTLELLLAVVVVLVVLVTVSVGVVVVVVMVVVVLLVAMVLVEESLDLIDEALIDQKLEGLPVLVVLDGTLQSAVEVQLKAEPDLLTFQLVLKLVEELTVVVAVVVVVVTVVAVVVLVAMSVEVVVVVAVMVMGVDGDISIDFSHLGNSDVGLVGSAVVSMVVVMAVMMGMMNRGRGIIDVVTEVEDVGRLVGEFSVGGSRNDGGSEAEEGDGDDLGLHCGSCSLDRELES
jgi:hypothetical protein